MTGALLVVVACVGLIGISLWAIVDASLQTNQAYAAAGISRGLVTAMLILTCTVGALVYLLFIRPRLVRTR